MLEIDEIFYKKIMPELYALQTLYHFSILANFRKILLFFKRFGQGFLFLHLGSTFKRRTVQNNTFYLKLKKSAKNNWIRTECTAKIVPLSFCGILCKISIFFKLFWNGFLFLHLDSTCKRKTVRNCTLYWKLQKSVEKFESRIDAHKKLYHF